MATMKRDAAVLLSLYFAMAARKHSFSSRDPSTVLAFMDELDSDGSCSDYEDFYDGDCEELENYERDSSDMFDMPGADYISSGSSLAGQLQYILYFTSILNNKN